MRGGLHAVLSLASALAFVTTYSLLEEATRLGKISETSKSAAEPLHGQQCQLITLSQRIGSSGEHVFEQG